MPPNRPKGTSEQFENLLGMGASRPHKTYVPEILLSKSQQLFSPSLACTTLKPPHSSSCPNTCEIRFALQKSIGYGLHRRNA